MLYMVVERFTRGPRPVYTRFRERGRMAPDGLRYVSSVVSADGMQCWQLMECEDAALLEVWMSEWRDLVSFDVVPVIESAEAAARFGPPAARTS